MTMQIYKPCIESPLSMLSASSDSLTPGSGAPEKTLLTKNKSEHLIETATKKLRNHKTLRTRLTVDGFHPDKFSKISAFSFQNSRLALQRKKQPKCIFPQNTTTKQHKNTEA